MRLHHNKTLSSPQTTVNAASSPSANIYSQDKLDAAIKKKVKKEMKEVKHRNKEGFSPASREVIEPPKLHRDMRLICDVFRISEQSRYALRSFDAATLEDFSLMTDEDFAGLVVNQARINQPLPPLQQRKLRILLVWVRSLSTSLDKEEVFGEDETPAKTVGFTQKDNEDGGILKSSSYNLPSVPKRDGIPSNWESKFYDELPRLRRELREAGGQRPFSNWATEFLSLRWAFCG